MNGRKKMVWMSRRVAERWLREVSFPEYRVRVLFGGKEARNILGLLRSFRDGKVGMKGVPRVTDLGVKEDLDGLDLWSKDREGLMSLVAWFEKRGFETTGVW